MLKRPFIFGVVALILGAYALPALAQQTTPTTQQTTPTTQQATPAQSEVTCADVEQAVLQILTAHGEGTVSTEEAGAQVAQVLQAASTAGVTCSKEEIAQLGSAIQGIEGASDVMSAVGATFGTDLATPDPATA